MSQTSDKLSQGFLIMSHGSSIRGGNDGDWGNLPYTMACQMPQTPAIGGQYFLRQKWTQWTGI